MIGTARHYWQKALKSFSTAGLILKADPDSATSRAYYSAFYAVSALFELEGKSFSKHSAVEGAVHRELVKNWGWPAEIGKDFSKLREQRETADYGVVNAPSEEDATLAVERARRILTAIQEKNPDTFVGPLENP